MAFVVAPVSADEIEDDYEWAYTLIHSDLPLYDFEWDDFWPRSIAGEEIIAGCASRIAFGDWQFIPNPADEYGGDPSWYRLSNYGVFHCAINIRTAYERAELNEGEFSRGFFARIGRGKRGNQELELWVLQQGMVPGSEYTLLAREPDDEGVVAEFRVLQSRCPEENHLEARNMDIWTTSYCKINDRAQLLRFARQMLREPDFGSLQLVNEEKEGSEAEFSDPPDDTVSD